MQLQGLDKKLDQIVVACSQPQPSLPDPRYSRHMNATSSNPMPIDHEPIDQKNRGHRDSFRRGSRDQTSSSRDHFSSDFETVQHPYKLLHGASPLSYESSPQLDPLIDPFPRSPALHDISSGSIDPSLYQRRTSSAISPDPLLGVIPNSDSASRDNIVNSRTSHCVLSPSPSNPISPPGELKAPLATPEIQNEEDSL